MKKCNRCKKEKPVGEFNYKNKEKGLLQYQCKDCSRFYLREHYLKNTTYYLEKARKRNKKISNEVRLYIWQYLIAHPCADCGEKDPIVLEFDHISDKIADVSRMHRNFTLKKVKEEIEKCVVRCANCHRRKTAKQFGWNRQVVD